MFFSSDLESLQEGGGILYQKAEMLEEEKRNVFSKKRECQHLTSYAN